MTKNTIPNIWTAQEKVLHLYKMLALGLGVFAVVMVIFSVIQAFKNPIVVVRNADRQEFYPSERRRSPLEKADVEAFTKNFLASLYSWREFSGEKLAREIAPYAESGLVSKAVEAQAQKYAKELKGKRLEQAITFVKVDVLDDRVVCHFDRVLKIEGIPLVIPTTVTLSMIQDTVTRINPMGIYVSGILESDNAK